ncbi:MAG TPA: hypothetical protein ENG36_04015 [Lentisphaerae bacterium]|nr:hypothetical protein [Lentisphaerota bacterium]
MSRRLHRRWKQHLRSQNGWTARADDWQVVFSECKENYEEARKLERRIKARGARRFLAWKSGVWAERRVPPVAG